MTRRAAIARSMGGWGSVVLSMMLRGEARASGGNVYDLLPRRPLFAAKVKAVIFLFMPGGPSHVDLLDPKPVLTQFDGKEPPIKVVSRRDVAKPSLTASPFRFARHGQSGIEVAELLPWKWKVCRFPISKSPLPLLGVDVRKLTYEYEGRMETLIGVSPARVLKEIIA
jgi:hypothetical protein